MGEDPLKDSQLARRWLPPHRPFFQNMSVHGRDAETDYQKNVGNIWLEMSNVIRKATGMGKKRKVDILHNFGGVTRSGEMLGILGPPGAGCSIYVDDKATSTTRVSPRRRYSDHNAKPSIRRGRHPLLLAPCGRGFHLRLPAWLCTASATLPTLVSATSISVAFLAASTSVHHRRGPALQSAFQR